MRLLFSCLISLSLFFGFSLFCCKGWLNRKLWPSLLRKHLCLWPRIALFYAIGQIFLLSVLFLSPDIGICDSCPFLVTRFNTFFFFLYYIEDKNHRPLACLNLLLLELKGQTVQRPHCLMWYFTVVLPTRIESHLWFSLWAQLRNQLGKNCKCHIKFKYHLGCC